METIPSDFISVFWSPRTTNVVVSAFISNQCWNATNSQISKASTWALNVDGGMCSQLPHWHLGGDIARVGGEGTGGFFLSLNPPPLGRQQGVVSPCTEGNTAQHHWNLCCRGARGSHTRASEQGYAIQTGPITPTFELCRGRFVLLLSALSALPLWWQTPAI